MANVLLIAVVPLMVVTRRSSVKEKIHIYICIYIICIFFLFFRIFNNTMKGKLKLLVFIFIYCCFYNQLSGKNRIE